MRQGDITMTLKQANEHIRNIFAEAKGTVTNVRGFKRCVQRYCKRQGLKYRDGEPTIVYESGSERVLLISKNERGGIHIDIAVSPAYCFLDQMDIVILGDKPN